MRGLVSASQFLATTIEVWPRAVTQIDNRPLRVNGLRRGLSPFEFEDHYSRSHQSMMQANWKKVWPEGIRRATT
jgi:hypothetical protein